MKFTGWMLKYKGHDTPRGDLIQDMFDDGEFPTENSYELMLSHIRFRSGYNTQIINVFKRAWKSYIIALDKK